jgi:hypothetical protein
MNQDSLRQIYLIIPVESGKLKFPPPMPSCGDNDTQHGLCP